MEEEYEIWKMMDKQAKELENLNKRIKKIERR